MAGEGGVSGLPMGLPLFQLRGVLGGGWMAFAAIIFYRLIDLSVNITVCKYLSYIYTPLLINPPFRVYQISLCLRNEYRMPLENISHTFCIKTDASKQEVNTLACMAGFRFLPPNLFLYI